MKENRKFSSLPHQPHFKGSRVTDGWLNGHPVGQHRYRTCPVLQKVLLASPAVRALGGMAPGTGQCSELVPLPLHAPAAQELQRQVPKNRCSLHLPTFLHFLGQGFTAECGSGTPGTEGKSQSRQSHSLGLPWGGGILTCSD